LTGGGIPWADLLPLVLSPKLDCRERRKPERKDAADGNQPKLFAKHRVNDREKGETKGDGDVPPR
jgi:hypothetical protein